MNMIKHMSAPGAGKEIRVVLRCLLNIDWEIIALMPDSPGAREGEVRSFTVKGRFADVNYKTTLRNSDPVDMEDQGVIDILHDIRFEGVNPRVVMAARKRPATVTA